MNLRPTRALAAALAASLALPLYVAPGTGVAQIEEIVVTTRRKEENLQDIPVAVSAFSAEMIEKQGLSSAADFVELIPGVQFDQTFSAADTRISIRGINNSRGRTSVAVLMDGVDVSGENITSGGGSSLLNSRLLDLERVEVIKGPQSALYGRNAFAGAINYITKKPSMDGLRITASGDVAEYGTYDMRGSISGPIVADKFALSFNAGYYESDGYYSNHNPDPLEAYANVGLGGAESSGVRLAALWTPSETWTVTGNVSYTENRFQPRAIAKYAVANRFYNTYGREIVDDNGNPVTTPDYREASPDCCDDTITEANRQWYGQWSGTVGNVSEEQVSLSPSYRTGGAFQGSSDEQLFTYLKAEWNAGPVLVKSSTSYLHNEAWLHEDVDFQDGVGTPVTRQFGSGPFTFVDTYFSLDVDYMDTTDTNYIAQEFTVETAEWDRGRVLFGVSGFWEDTENQDMSLGFFNAPNFAAGLPTFCTPLRPLDLACSFRDTAILGEVPKETTRDTTSYSAFGLFGYDITDTFKVTAELRYIRDEIEVCTNTLVDRVSQYLLTYPIDYQIADYSEEIGLPDGVLVDLPVCDTQISDTVNPRLALDYKLTDDVLLYASGAKGTKPAGFGTTQFVEPRTAQIEQEKLWAYEIGAKTAWLGGTLRANSALFYGDYSNRQVGVTITTPSGIPGAGVGNAGEAETYGVELDFTWQPLDELTLQLAYAYTHAEWKDFNLTQIRNDKVRPGDPPPTPTATNRDQAECQQFTTPEQEEAIANGDLVVESNCAGTRIAGIPEHSASFAANYTRAMTDWADWFVDFSASYEGKRTLFETKIAPTVDSHFVANLAIGLTAPMWSAQIYADNLFDDDTVRWGSYTQDFKDGMYGGSSGGEPRDRVVFAILPPPRVVGLRATFKFE
jgi:iron complex outermembrane recepter protein